MHSENEIKEWINDRVIEHENSANRIGSVALLIAIAIQLIVLAIALH